MFDSLTAARQLTEAGMERAHADAIANAIRQAVEHREHVTPAQLATGLNTLRADVTAELSTLRADVTGGLNALRAESTAGLKALRAELAASEFRLTWRVACMMLAQTVATVGGLLVVLLLRG